ncbi:MAG: hypothetical protein ACK4UN_14680, partial [Limisphaerales bacterium]
MSRVAIASAGVVPGFILVGWLLNIPAFYKWIGSEPSHPLTAIIVLLAAGAAWTAQNRGVIHQRISTALAATVGLLGLWSLAEAVIGGQTPGKWLVLQMPAAPAEPFAMSGLSAGSLLFLSMAMLLRDTPARRKYSAGQWLCLVPLVLSLMVAVAYIYGAEPIYTFTKRVSMAFPSALAILALSVGTVLLSLDRLP